MRVPVTGGTFTWMFPKASVFVVAGLASVFAASNALAAPSACNAISGNLVANCGFETGNFTDWTQSGNTGFTSVTSPSVPSQSLFVHSGSYGVFEGPSGSDGFLSQTLATTAGTSYSISVWYEPSGDTPSDFRISWDGNTLLDLTNVTSGWLQTFGAPVWLDETVTALGTGSDTLSIGFLDDNSYSGIDDISVVAASTSAVPEPASLALLGMGLAGLGVIRRRKRA